MRSKWYISTLIVFLALLTALVQQQFVAPNQEVVLQFQENDTSLEDAQETIEIITKRLQELGVQEVQIIEEGDQIKITYYSDHNVASIKEQLQVSSLVQVNSASNDLDKGRSNLPIDEQDRVFNLDVFEIQKEDESQRGLEGTLVFEFDPLSDRLIKPEQYGATHSLDSESVSELTALALKVNKRIVLAIGSPLFIIPEVRARPTA